MEGTPWTYGIPSVSVIGDGYCFPYPMELIVKKRIRKLSNAQFEIFDLSGNLRLQVDGGVWNLNMKRIIRDPAGFPILTLRGKALTFWHKWKVYEGESKDENNCLFSIQQSHPLQIKKELHVFLSNYKKKDPDFHVTGSYTSLSFKVYKGHRLLAEVKHTFSMESFYKGKEKYRIKVYPEVDYAFIVALLLIIDENDTP
ncbi:protein LURP-one-related 14-like isoform X2 [Mercurialis annua]|uniref:protein LURP-one-related 14-like isoform X2 n=1 Tax=Mercurialis annua TaxID=3986 RepID=UPI002160A07C|nr:protein LURP-one-related 14-like isoform X2 [Mercurialis annua]